LELAVLFVNSWWVRVRGGLTSGHVVVCG
jgi:hypothetical protein